MNSSAIPYQSLVEDAPIGVYRVSEAGEVLYANDTFAEMVGLDGAGTDEPDGEDIEGTNPIDWEAFRTRVEAEGEVSGHEIEVRTDTGETYTLLLSGRLDDGVLTGYATDVTDQRRLQQKSARQAEAILDLSAPVVEIWEGVTLATVIGTLDTRRAQRLTEDMLDEVTESKSQVTLIDITGVPSIDTATAQHLIDTVNAVNLLGSSVIITGIKPDIAQTLVHLGIPMGDIETKSSLSEGLELAMRRLEELPGAELTAVE